MKLTKEQEQEIKDLQTQENKTKRVVAQSLKRYFMMQYQY